MSNKTSRFGGGSRGDDEGNDEPAAKSSSFGKPADKPNPFASRAPANKPANSDDDAADDDDEQPVSKPRPASPFGANRTPFNKSSSDSDSDSDSKPPAKASTFGSSRVGGSSIGGKPGDSPKPGASSPFGSKSADPAKTSSSVFGSKTSETAKPSSPIFGGSKPADAPKSSPFGAKSDDKKDDKPANPFAPRSPVGGSRPDDKPADKSAGGGFRSPFGAKPDDKKDDKPADKSAGGGFRSPFGAKPDDKKDDKPSGGGFKSPFGAKPDDKKDDKAAGGGFKLPFGGKPDDKKDDRPAPSKTTTTTTKAVAPAAARPDDKKVDKPAGGGFLGGLTGRLPFGAKPGDKKDAKAAPKPAGTFGKPAVPPAAGAKPVTGAASGAAATKAISKPSAAPAKEAPKTPPARTGTARPLANQTRVTVKGQGLSLDQKLDLVGYTMMILAVITFFGIIQPSEGSITATVVKLLGELFGVAKYAWPLILMSVGLWLLIRRFQVNPFLVIDPQRVIGGSLFYLTIVTICQWVAMLPIKVPPGNLTMLAKASDAVAPRGGGQVGSMIYKALVSITGTGTLSDLLIPVILVGMLLISSVLAFNFSLGDAILRLRSVFIFVSRVYRSYAEARRAAMQAHAETRAAREAERAAKIAAAAPPPALPASTPAAATLVTAEAAPALASAAPVKVEPPKRTLFGSVPAKPGTAPAPVDTADEGGEEGHEITPPPPVRPNPIGTRTGSPAAATAAPAAAPIAVAVPEPVPVAATPAAPAGRGGLFGARPANPFKPSDIPKDTDSKADDGPDATLAATQAVAGPADAPKPDAQKTDGPRPDTAKTDAPRADSKPASRFSPFGGGVKNPFAKAPAEPKADDAKVDAPKAEAAQIDAADMKPARPKNPFGVNPFAPKPAAQPAQPAAAPKAPATQVDDGKAVVAADDLPPEDLKPARPKNPFGVNPFASKPAAQPAKPADAPKAPTPTADASKLDEDKSDAPEGELAPEDMKPATPKNPFPPKPASSPVAPKSAAPAPAAETAKADATKADDAEEGKADAPLDEPPPDLKPATPKSPFGARPGVSPFARPSSSTGTEVPTADTPKAAAEPEKPAPEDQKPATPKNPFAAKPSSSPFASKVPAATADDESTVPVKPATSRNPFGANPFASKADAPKADAPQADVPRADVKDPQPKAEPPKADLPEADNKPPADVPEAKVPAAATSRPNPFATGGRPTFSSPVPKANPGAPPDVNARVADDVHYVDDPDIEPTASDPRPVVTARPDNTPDSTPPAPPVIPRPRPGGETPSIGGRPPSSPFGARPPVPGESAVSVKSPETATAVGVKEPAAPAPASAPAATAPTTAAPAPKVSNEGVIVRTRPNGTLKPPDFHELLEPGSQQNIDDAVLKDRAAVIEETLKSFGAPGKVVEINAGPVITQFGVEPDFLVSRQGKRTRVKVGAIARLDDDLALALAARTIRIEAPVPGKSYVGIEVPNAETAMVSLRDIMESDEFQKIQSNLAIALGRSVDGTPIAADLAQMPHLLIAGTTGSGKSVCVNAIIACLLIRNSPDELKFIMVDPKRVELTGYNGIPHLVSPVVVDLERIVGVLKWVTREMEERYKKFAQAGARNIQDFNNRVGPSDPRLPYLVVVVDELADLMMLAPEETERVLTRLAQMARATGIHLIISTQRPSVDVVTGLIKANFPARISFAVASSVDSRVVLDQPGAEKLLGRGDMLYQSPEAAAPLRMQGVFVSDVEINRLTKYWKTAVPSGSNSTGMSTAVDLSDKPDPVQSRTERFGALGANATRAPWDSGGGPSRPTLAPASVSLNNSGSLGATNEDDEMYDAAVDLVKRANNKASISLLQRRLKVGYTRAARLIELMKQRGVIDSAATTDSSDDEGQS